MLSTFCVVAQRCIQHCFLVAFGQLPPRTLINHNDGNGHILQEIFGHVIKTDHRFNWDHLNLHALSQLFVEQLLATFKPFGTAQFWDFLCVLFFLVFGGYRCFDAQSFG